MKFLLKSREKDTAMKTLEEFISEIASSAKLRKEFDTIRDRESLEAFLSRHNCKATGADFAKFFRSQNTEGEIPDDDVATVAGGAQITLRLDPAVIAAYGLD